MKSVIALLAGAALTSALAVEAILPQFSAMEAGAEVPGWQPVELRGRSPGQFEIVGLAEGNVLQVTADNAASAIAYPVNVSADVAFLKWQWKIDKHIAATDISTRQGDDFPVRVYVTFDRDIRELPFSTRLKIRLARTLYGTDIPTAALCYVWADDLPVDTIVPNAYSDTVMMVVVRNGSAAQGWQTERRDPGADYQAAFGAAAPPVTSVMLAADTDDTGAFVRSWFGDIAFMAAE